LLEEIRLLGNLEGRAGKALFVLLVAQPGLRDQLARPEAAVFAQRVATRCRIDPLTREAAAHFVWHQIAAAGGDPAGTIQNDALNLHTAHARGVPRLLNQAAHLAFTLAHAAGEPAVDIESAMESLTRLGLMAAEPESADVPALFAHPARPEQPAPAARSRAGRAAVPADGGERAPDRPPKQKARRKSA
jgi:hypothetical protein